MPTTAQIRQASYGPDQAPYAAASLRAPLRTETLPITVTTASKTFVVPDAWKGTFVTIEADGGDIGIQISVDAASAAVCDVAARAVETGGPPIVLTPPAPPNGCFRIFDKNFRDLPFPTNAVTFALIGSVACVARCHPAET
jgi:hypothetical protein